MPVTTTGADNEVAMPFDVGGEGRDQCQCITAPEFRQSAGHGRYALAVNLMCSAIAGGRGRPWLNS